MLGSAMQDIIWKPILLTPITVSLVETCVYNTHSSHSSSTNTSIQALAVAPPVLDTGLWGTYKRQTYRY